MTMSLPTHIRQDFNLPQPPLLPPPPPSISDTKEVPEGVVATLLVRHLPEGIPDDMLSRLFAHYGASSVRPCTGGRLRNCAFVDFKDEALATQAHLQLNRLRFLGKVITVDRADRSTSKNINSQSAGLHLKDVSGTAKDASLHPKSVEFGASTKLSLAATNSCSCHLLPPFCLVCISSSRWKYIDKYCQCSHCCPSFLYAAPFRMALPTPPLPPPVPAPPPPPPPAVPKPHLSYLSSSESELELSEEDNDDGHTHKRAKREAIVGPAVDKGVEHEAVGLKPAALVPKEIPMIKKKNPVLQIKITAKPAQKDLADDGNRSNEPSVSTNEEKTYLTPEEIGRGKMPPEEILSLPMFKNYATGNPATVLYIKNLAKDVIVDDFYFIFGSLFESAEVAKSNLNIKLMQEGRMRGQAFVTFPTVDLARQALNLVNGYLFKGKAIIIQFGRSPSAKPI